MNVFKVAILTICLGLALGMSAPANALGRFITSNAVDKCQSFTPGVSNTIRNRVAGAENVGAAPIAVACVFEMNEIAGGGAVDVNSLRIYFLNGSAAATTVTCTKLSGSSAPGFGAIGGSQTVSTASMPAGGTGFVSFGAETGVFAIGVNCTIPQNVTIATTNIVYTDDEV